MILQPTSTTKIILKALLIQRDDQGGVFRDKVFGATEYRWQFSIGCIHA